MIEKNNLATGLLMLSALTIGCRGPSLDIASPEVAGQSSGLSEGKLPDIAATVQGKVLREYSDPHESAAPLQGMRPAYSFRIETEDGEKLVSVRSGFSHVSVDDIAALIEPGAMVEIPRAQLSWQTGSIWSVDIDTIKVIPGGAKNAKAELENFEAIQN